jgi:protein FAM50
MKTSREAQQVKEDVTRKKAKLQEQQGLVMPTFAAPAPEAAPAGGSVGLLTVEEFRRKREEMVRVASEQKQQAAVKKKAADVRAQKAARARRSFADEEKEEEEEGGEEREGEKGPGKDPAAETGFLPDRAREAEERRMRDELAQQWQQRQEQVKAEPMVVVFSFWDGKVRRL